VYSTKLSPLLKITKIDTPDYTIAKVYRCVPFGEFSIIAPDFSIKIEIFMKVISNYSELSGWLSS